MRLVISDTSDDFLEETFDHLLLWQSYGKEGRPNIISVPALVEKNAASLRQRYLALIHDLGEAKIGELKLVERLELRPGFSYWWMSR